MAISTYGDIAIGGQSVLWPWHPASRYQQQPEPLRAAFKIAPKTPCHSVPDPGPKGERWCSFMSAKPSWPPTY